MKRNWSLTQICQNQHKFPGCFFEAEILQILFLSFQFLFFCNVVLPRSRKIFNAADFLEALIAKSTQNASVRKIAIRFNKKFFVSVLLLGRGIWSNVLADRGLWWRQKAGVWCQRSPFAVKKSWNESESWFHDDEDDADDRIVFAFIVFASRGLFYKFPRYIQDYLKLG